MSSTPRISFAGPYFAALPGTVRTRLCACAGRWLRSVETPFGEINPMRKLDVILKTAFDGWDQRHLSEPARVVLRELAKDARFDEITEVLNGFKKNANAQEMATIIGHVPGIICNSYIYPNSGVAPSVIDAHWSDSGAASAVAKAATREGLLHMTVDKVVARLKAIEQDSAQEEKTA